MKAQTRTLKTLSIDLAYKSWRELGSALLEFSPRRWQKVALGVCSWPEHPALDPMNLAAVLAEFVREYDVHMLILDGPQAWKDPESQVPHCRLAESFLHTPGKTGVFGQAVPRNYLPFIAFSIAVFQQLIQEHGFLIFNYTAPVAPQSSPWIAESFPAASWREIGIKPLPAKRKTETRDLAAWLSFLRRHVNLPRPEGYLSHDNLQALIGGLAGAAALGGPAKLRVYGRPLFQGLLPLPHYLEGYILTAH